MALITETDDSPFGALLGRDTLGLRRDAERAMSLPLGLANPFWILFGAAATAGMTWWWFSRLARSASMEAMSREASAIYEMAEATASTAPVAFRRDKSRKAKAAPDATETEDFDSPEMFENAESAGYPRIVLEPTAPEGAREATHEAQIPAETSATPDHAGYPAVAPGPEAAAAADDLTRLTGVGPRIAAALAAHGVTRFAQLAAWTPEQLSAFDAEMNLRGRALRGDWIAQARALSENA
jgi:predicted flap endonuclease-1-like 5' DNA nuclease